MPEIDRANFNRLYVWDKQMGKGESGPDEWALDLLRADLDFRGEPLIMELPRSTPAVEAALAAGVNFRRRKTDGSTVLFCTSFGQYNYSTDGFALLAHHLAQFGEIDLTEEEGLTALSVQVKFGNIEHARTLLELGANPNSFGVIESYGNAHLYVSTQAINVLADALDEKRDQLSVALLQLLKDYGLNPPPAEREKLKSATLNRPIVHGWLLANL